MIRWARRQEGKKADMDLDDLRRPRIAIPFPVIVLVAAVCFHLVARIGRGLTPVPSLGSGIVSMATGVRARYRIRVLLMAPLHSTWRDTLWHLVRHAHAPRGLQFCVLLECKDVEEAQMDIEVDPELRPLTRVVQVRARSETKNNPAHTLRRLTRRFVDGGETAVVAMDHRLRLEPNWDASVAHLLYEAPPKTVISAPAASRGRVGAFPTRRKRSTGTIARDDAKLFYDDGSDPVRKTVPSVCWCAEFTATHPATLRGGWPRKTSSLFSSVEHSADVLVRVPTFSMVERNAAVEEEYLDADEGCDEDEKERRCGKAERVGLTHSADDEERILKFGSSRGARLAVEFA